jgi:hypothetical protein
MSSFSKTCHTFAVALASLLATEFGYADSYTVSGYTFEKPHNVSHDSSSDSGSSQHERSGVREVEEESEPDTRASEEAYREQQAAQRRLEKQRQKELAKIELRRVKSNEEMIAEWLRVATATPTVKHQELPIFIPITNPRAEIRLKTLETSIEGPTAQVEFLRNEARSEYFWFQMNQYDLYWGAIGAGLDPTGTQPDLDATASEAADHLRRYLEILRKLESINHTAEYAQKRYDQRVKLLTFLRSRSYNVETSISTAKTDIYPPRDEFGPWSEEELLKEGVRCKFDFKGICR